MSLDANNIKLMINEALNAQLFSSRLNFTCAYHCNIHANRTLEMAYSLIDEILKNIEQISAELGMSVLDLKEVLLYLPLALAYHDRIFELDDEGVPLSNNEMRSWSHLLVSFTPLKLEPTTEEFQILRSIILHTQVHPEDAENGLVIASPKFSGTTQIQFAQLLAELCDKGNSRSFLADGNPGEFDLLSASSEVDKAIIMDILLLIEMQLRQSKPKTHGQAFNQAKAFCNEAGFATLTENAMSMLSSFTRNSVVSHVRQKVAKSQLGNSPTLVGLLETLFQKHTQMADYLDLMLNDKSQRIMTHKGYLCELALATLDVPSV
jgi:hypothetical protein